MTQNTSNTRAGTELETLATSRLSSQPTTRVKAVSPLMQQALSKMGSDWGPYPHGVYDRTLQAMVKRGLIEERNHKHENGARSFQYRLAVGAQPAGSAS